LTKKENTMSTLKAIGQATLMGALPALVLTIAMSNPLSAQKTVKSGTTTTYNGVPACDCSSNNGQCGCVQ
jgi:hypothetical protein